MTTITPQEKLFSSELREDFTRKAFIAKLQKIFVISLWVTSFKNLNLKIDASSRAALRELLKHSGSRRWTSKRVANQPAEGDG